jgi:hypothetical protein
MSRRRLQISELSQNYVKQAVPKFHGVSNEMEFRSCCSRSASELNKCMYEMVGIVQLKTFNRRYEKYMLMFFPDCIFPNSRAPLGL